MSVGIEVTVAVTDCILNSMTAPRIEPSAPPKNAGAFPTAPVTDSGIGSAGINAATTYKVIAKILPIIMAKKYFITAFGFLRKARGKR